MIRLALGLLFFSVPSLAADPCFRDTLPIFQKIAQFDANTDSRRSAMANACRELKVTLLYEAKSMGERLIADPVVGTVNVVAGSAPAAFARLGGTPRQEAFKKELEQIRQDPNPMSRIKKVYELVARNQGHYDSENIGALKFQTPGNLLNRVDNMGTAGVCRDFAALLQWSLMQVYRHPSSTGPALGPTDFSSEVVTGAIPGRRGWEDTQHHAWIRINLPQFDGQLLDGFHHFDLDTTWYSEQFSPLMPRRSALSEENRTKALGQCEQIQACLLERMSRETPAAAADSAKPSLPPPEPPAFGRQ